MPWGLSRYNLSINMDIDKDVDEAPMAMNTDTTCQHSFARRKKIMIDIKEMNKRLIHPRRYIKGA